MTTISRRKSLAAIGAATAAIATGTVPAIASTNTESDAELSAAIADYQAAEAAVKPASDRVAAAEEAIGRDRPTRPMILIGHRTIKDELNGTVTREPFNLTADDINWMEKNEAMRQRRLDALDQHDAACQRAQDAHNLEDLEKNLYLAIDAHSEAFDRVLATPARTIGGLAAKLDVARIWLEAHEDSDMGDNGAAIVLAVLDDAKRVAGRAQS